MSFFDEPKDDGLDNETVKLIHDLVSELEREGFTVKGCSMCNNRYPSRPAKCRFCGKLCFPKDQMNN